MSRPFGQPPEENAVLVAYDTQADGARSLEQKLVGLDGVTTLYPHGGHPGKPSAPVWRAWTTPWSLIIVCAAALAFVVLYNLTNINITERMRELATLKVLGFYDGEAVRLYLPGERDPHGVWRGPGHGDGEAAPPVAGC